MLTILNSTPSIIDQYLHELRDVEIQKDRPRFETNIERLGMLAGYEVSKRLTYKTIDTPTVLGVAKTPVVADEIVIATILRAGIPVQRGVHKVLDGSALAFIGAARQEEDGEGIQIKLDYVAAPRLEGKVLIIADTMLATGHSLVDSYCALVAERGTPKQTIIVAVISCQPGIEYLQSELPDAEIIVCAVDPELNEHYYIVPGLGDAGDLLYGPKD